MKKNRKTRIYQLKDTAYWLDYPNQKYIVQEKIGWWIFGFWQDIAIFDNPKQAEEYIKNNYQ